MPNWIEGTFRARGSKDNIKKFILEGLEACYRLNITTEIEENDDSLYITFKNQEAAENDKIEYPKTLHIKDTRRNFIEDLCYGEIYAYKKDNGEFQFVSSFKSAWAIDTEPLVNIAKKICN